MSNPNMEPGSDNMSKNVGPKEEKSEYEKMQEKKDYCVNTFLEALNQVLNWSLMTKRGYMEDNPLQSKKYLEDAINRIEKNYPDHRSKLEFTVKLTYLKELIDKQEHDKIKDFVDTNTSYFKANLYKK